jgi:hypothetical protein
MTFLNEKVKYILIDITVVFLIPIGLFFLYTTLSTPGDALYSIVRPGSELAGQGQKFLVELTELNALKLDTSIFESLIYKSLVDTTVPPLTEEKGRLYPFVPPSRTLKTTSSSFPVSSKTGTSNAVKNLNALILE